MVCPTACPMSAGLKYLWVGILGFQSLDLDGGWNGSPLMLCPFWIPEIVRLQNVLVHLWPERWVV